jgi:hypothetical protein
MSSQLESIYSDELILLAETLGEVKTRTEKLEGEFSTHAKPLEAATNALSAALSGIKALQFHVLDNNLGALSARVEEMRKAVDEQVGVIALELKKADETNAAKAGADAEALRSEIVALQSQLGSLVTQFGQQLERVEFAAKEEAKKLQLMPGPAGAAGASLNPRGTFIDGEVYNRLDVVSWLGSSYIATVDGVTEKPSKNSNQWQTLASRGGGGAGGVGDFGSLAGVAQINQGGTGQTTRALALNALLPDQAGSTQYMLLTDGSGTVSWGAQPVAGLPSQTSNSGRLLTTNGSTASWSNAVTVSGSNATVGGTLTVSSTDDASNKDTGSLVLEGGLGVEKNIISGLGLSVRGAVTLPTAWTGAYGLGFEYGSAISRIFFGDGTGYSLKFVSRASSTTTDRMTLTDTGNLTVGGTLTMSGKAASSGYVYAGGTLSAFESAAGLYSYYSGGGVIGAYSDSSGTRAAMTIDGTTLSLRPNGVTADRLLIDSNGITAKAVTVSGTTASTSTSSGALVVGNGTSGGLGVGGNASIGGTVFLGTGSDVQASRTAAGVLDVRHPSNTTSRIDVQGATSAGLGLRQSGTRDWFVSAESNELRTSCLTANSVASYESGVLVRVRDTTASTSTSSGALVVSGGVGVAGTLCVGGGIAAYNDSVFLSPTTFVARSDGTNASLYLRANGTGKVIIDIGSGGLDVSAGPIRTAAPSGGTAANWKLGTVASVSPTSPNRTIEVDIGGTIYYIHAKTTNN